MARARSQRKIQPEPTLTLTNGYHRDGVSAFSHRACHSPAPDSQRRASTMPTPERLRRARGRIEAAQRALQGAADAAERASNSPRYPPLGRSRLRPPPSDHRRPAMTTMTPDPDYRHNATHQLVEKWSDRYCDRLRAREIRRREEALKLQDTLQRLGLPLGSLALAYPEPPAPPALPSRHGAELPPRHGITGRRPGARAAALAAGAKVYTDKNGILRYSGNCCPAPGRRRNLKTRQPPAAGV